MDPEGARRDARAGSRHRHNKGINLILSSHLLPDVEYTCDHVVVLDKGAVATQGPISALKGTAGRVFELRVKGDDRLRGGAARRRPRVPRGRRGRHARLRPGRAGDHSCCFSSPSATACRCGICGPACRRSRTCSRAPSESRSGADSRSGLSTLRRTSATPHGRGWWVIARAGIMERLRERRFLGLLLFAWGPFLVRAVQLYVGETIRRRRLLAPTAQTFREFLDQQSIFVFFVTIYVGAGLIANDRRANALQIYLSKPLTRVDYIVGKLLTLRSFSSAVTWVPAILLLVLQMMFAGEPGVCRATSVPVPGDHARFRAPGGAGRPDDAGAVVAVEQPPLRVDDVRRHRVLHRRDARAPRHRPATRVGAGCRRRTRSLVRDRRDLPQRAPDAGPARRGAR